ncbi:hypothetical protein MMC28_004122 [Mycoblastus sanguinarius]|nr:hypothetical protein [Mycoblastus sanguinarius]
MSKRIMTPVRQKQPFANWHSGVDEVANMALSSSAAAAAAAGDKEWPSVFLGFGEGGLYGGVVVEDDGTASEEGLEEPSIWFEYLIRIGIALGGLLGPCYFVEEEGDDKFTREERALLQHGNPGLNFVFSGTEPTWRDLDLEQKDVLRDEYGWEFVSRDKRLQYTIKKLKGIRNTNAVTVKSCTFEVKVRFQQAAHNRLSERKEYFRKRALREQEAVAEATWRKKGGQFDARRRWEFQQWRHTHRQQEHEFQDMRRRERRKLEEIAATKNRQLKEGQEQAKRLARGGHAGGEVGLIGQKRDMGAAVAPGAAASTWPRTYALPVRWQTGRPTSIGEVARYDSGSAWRRR